MLDIYNVANSIILYRKRLESNAQERKYKVHTYYHAKNVFDCVRLQRIIRIRQYVVIMCSEQNRNDPARATFDCF